MKLSQPQKVALFLTECPNQKFTARQIAQEIIKRHTDDYILKRNNPRFHSDEEFIGQIAAEIGAHKAAILKFEPQIQMRDKPRPRIYWFDEYLTNEQNHPLEIAINTEDEHDEAEVFVLDSSKNYSEHDLYPILIEYLSTQLDLHCLRIDEKNRVINVA